MYVAICTTNMHQKVKAKGLIYVNSSLNINPKKYYFNYL